MTEQEAMTKWCPMFRAVAATGDTSIFEADNRPLEYQRQEPATDGERVKFTPSGRIAEHARCLGSGCMWWRWDIVGDGRSTLRGHCGHAGRP